MMTKALDAVASGLPINTACIKLNVPRTTLLNKFKNPSSKENPGPPTVLTPEEEKSLVEWILNISKMGCPVTKDSVLNSVAMIVKNSVRGEKFQNNRPGRHWYEGFLRRHKEISTRCSENVSLARALVSEESLGKWFSTIDDYLLRIN